MTPKRLRTSIILSTLIWIPTAHSTTATACGTVKVRQFNTNMQGCNFWWIEYGGRLDTIHQTEEIKWELWKVVHGVWDYIKNSVNFPEAETMTLEWVGHIPGKLGSRRFEGDYIIRQQDLVEQRGFDDGVAHGGWAVDLHPVDGVYSKKAVAPSGTPRASMAFRGAATTAAISKTPSSPGASSAPPTSPSDRPG